jgi:hypothetical protein
MNTVTRRANDVPGRAVKANERRKSPFDRRFYSSGGWRAM